MSPTLMLPPGFRPRPEAGDPWGAALAAGRGGEEAGAVFWSGAGGRCRAALVFEPDRPLGPTVLRDLGLLAAYDALAALAPPQLPIAIAGPDGLALNGGRAASVRAEQAPGTVPDWAVLGVEFAVEAAGPEPGLMPDRTCLAEEGFGPVTAQEILEQFCRHLLVWLDAWQEEGAGGLVRTVAERTEGRRAA